MDEPECVWGRHGQRLGCAGVGRGEHGRRESRELFTGRAQLLDQALVLALEGVNALADLLALWVVPGRCAGTLLPLPWIFVPCPLPLPPTSPLLLPLPLPVAISVSFSFSISVSVMLFTRESTRRMGGMVMRRPPMGGVGGVVREVVDDVHRWEEPVYKVPRIGH